MIVSGTHFAPYCEVPEGKSSEPGPQVVNLTQIAQVFRTMYRGPWDKDVPLPPHYWEIQSLSDPFLFLESTRSDNYGFSGLPMTIKSQRKASAADPGEVKFVSLKKLPQDAEWYLTLRPDIPRAARAMVVQTGEIWIDLTNNTWVTKQEFPQHTKQKLLRLPLWTSRWKALSGGFVDGPAGKFQIGGVVTTAELVKPFGTVKRPWRILVDAGWWRTFLQIHYYDMHWKLHLNVPPGLTVKALGKKLDPRTLTATGNVVGGGTSVMDNGTLFVLHERTEEASSDVHFAFEDTSSNVRFVDTANVSLERKPAKEVPKEIDKRYVLPKAWHSFGWQARVGDAGERKPWSELRPSAVEAVPSHGLATSESAPLVFHLDDTVLYGRSGGAAIGPSVVNPGARVTLFSHRLAYRGTPDDVVPQWWKTVLSDNYIPAEEGIADNMQTRLETTFVIHHEGEFHTLRDLRVDGAFGGVRAIGARKAVARGADVVHERSPVEGDFVHTVLITDAYTGAHDAAYEGPFLAKNPDTQMCHLVVYQPLRIVREPGDPTASPPFKDVSDADVRVVHSLLMEAEERWDQHHPAHGAFSSAKKDYLALPEAGVKSGTRVVKLRHFFCPRTDGGQLLTLRITNEPGRSFVTKLPSQPSEKKLLLHMPNVSYEVFGAHDSDGVDEPPRVMAHEMGHVMSLPDEYMEAIDLDGIAGVDWSGPRVPRFRQRDQAYPFWLDENALQRWTALPRLRYFAHRMHFLNGACAPLLPAGPYVLRYPTFRGGLTYKLPPGTLPWDPLHTARLPGGRSTAVLYRVGDDEGTVETMFRRPDGNPTDAGGWLDGLVVVRTLIWFAFAASDQGTLTSDADRWTVLHDFYKRHILSNKYVPRSRFLLQGPAGALLSRIGVILEVRMEFAPVPSLDSNSKEATPALADFAVEVLFQKTAALPKPVGPSPLGSSALRIPQFELSPAILRHALGTTFDAGAPDNSDLHSGDVEVVARAVEGMLGSPANSFTPELLLVEEKP